MKLQYIYIIASFIFFSCKGNSDLNKNEISIAKEQPVAITNVDPNTERFKFSTISQTPIVDVKKESRDEIINRFKETDLLINVKNKTFRAGKECTFEYFEKKVTPIKYWYSQSTINTYKDELIKIGISLPEEFSVFMSAIPNKECEYPTSEYIFIDGKIIFIYEGYLIVFGNDKAISKNVSLPLKQEDLDKFEWETDNSLGNYNSRLLLEKYGDFNIILAKNDNTDDLFYTLFTKDKKGKTIDSLKVGYTEDGYPESNKRELIKFSINKNYFIILKRFNRIDYKDILKNTEEYTITKNGTFLKKK